MGFELRRQLREALGSDITGLQRAVALEIADDANEDTRRSWAALDDLARWTGAKDAVVVRNALKRLAVAGWEFRVPIGKGRDGRTLYAVPGMRMTFMVPRFEGVAPATSKEEPPLPQGVAVAHSEGATAHSEGAGATPFSSDPSTPQEEEASTQGGATATPSGADRDFTAEEMKEFGNFWLLHPKSQNQDDTRDRWKEAVASGVDPKQITAAAVAYAKEVATQEWRYIKRSDNWLRARRYEDKFAPEPNGKPNLRPVGGKSHQPYTPPTDPSVYESGFHSHARPQASGE
jgi:hypothetical protein